MFKNIQERKVQAKINSIANGCVPLRRDTFSPLSCCACWLSGLTSRDKSVETSHNIFVTSGTCGFLPPRHFRDLERELRNINRNCFVF